MPKIHNVILNDRITNISIKYYGTASKTGLIVNANPQLKGRPISLEHLPTIKPGDILNIPDETTNIINFPEKKTFPETVPIEKPDSIQFLVNDQVFSFFSNYSLNQSLDSFDNVGISVPLDDTNNLFKASFKPFTYDDIGVYYNGVLVFGGTIINPVSELNTTSKIVTISAYPKCGVLNDCVTPVSLYPVEFENQNLQQIADKLLEPFGLSAVFAVNPGNIFERVAPEPEQKVLNFLISLAKQRGLIITNTPQGNLLFWQADIESESVANFKEGERPLINCKPSFDDLNYFSHITGLLPVKESKGKKESKPKEKEPNLYTWENPFLVSKGILRPNTFIVEDSNNNDLRKIVEQRAGRMFGSVATYNLQAQGHRDENGDLYTKNKSINVLSPSSNIIRDTKFIIKNINLDRTPDGGDIANMNIVLPEVYNGEIPKVVPWE